MAFRAARQERQKERRDRFTARVDQRGKELCSVPAPAATRNVHPERDPEFDTQCEAAIPAVVRMISGCKDDQTSADVSNVADFQLPDVAGAAGGALTSSMLQVIYKEEQPSAKGLSFVDVFLRARDLVEKKGFTQIPQLSSSRFIDVNQPFDLMSNVQGNQGTRYALLIGINYETHKQGRLRGCHNDVHNIMSYITNVGGFEPANITLLLDDGKHTMPTKHNIMNALDELTEKCEAGDTAFVHYSGHGATVRDKTGEEKSGFCSTLVPVDYNQPGVGQILDKQLYEDLVCAMPAETSMTCMMDCCHSGTVLDLPYNFVADGEQTDMAPTADFPFMSLISMTRERREQRRVNRGNRRVSRREGRPNRRVGR